MLNDEMGSPYRNQRTVVAVAGYMVCSATLLIGNKLAVSLVPVRPGAPHPRKKSDSRADFSFSPGCFDILAQAPSFILWAQLFGTFVAVKGAHMAGVITNCDALESTKMQKFLPVALIFVATIFTNMKSLEYANVETFMIFRFSTPLAISVADWAFLGRHLPECRSWLSLGGLLLGALGYAYTDQGYEVHGYMFCALWYVIFCLDQIYLKHITNTVKMDSNWGHVIYSNLLASIPLFFLALREADAVRAASTHGLMVISGTVVLGVSMSYYAWLTRSLVSATLFTVLGNMCKVATIGINVALWDKHASPFGIGCLLFCLAAAYTYRQAPLREDHINTESATIPK